MIRILKQLQFLSTLLCWELLSVLHALFIICLEACEHPFHRRGSRGREVKCSLRPSRARTGAQAACLQHLSSDLPFHCSSGNQVCGRIPPPGPVSSPAAGSKRWIPFLS